MKDNRTSQVTRTVLFAAGFAVILLAVILLAPLSPNIHAWVFTAVDLLMLYGLLFGPLLAGGRISQLTGGRIVTLGIYWYALGLYALLTGFLIFTANTQSEPPMRLLVVAQLAGLFGLMLATFLADATQDHISSVEHAAQTRHATVEWLRGLSEHLVLNTARLAKSDVAHASELASLANSIADDLRYLSPIDRVDASAIEDRIAANLDTILQLTATDDIGMRDLEQACDVARQTQDLIAQRKLLRN